MVASTTYPPRPEAHAMDWQWLLPPVQRALGELLERLSSTVGSENDLTNVARCFFVTGERGSGKTTLLLTAQQLVKPMTTSPPSSERKPIVEPHVLQRLRAQAHWLDLVDLEPMPSSANYLTTLLVTIRGALAFRRDPSSQRSRKAGMLEELSGDVGPSLDRLITDSALVWEDILENDARERAHRQVAAAERYMSFGEDLARVVAKIGSELAQRRSSSEQPVTLILPIDNIDRSPDHLRYVFKLAQLVSCPHLVLLLAGDRLDVNELLMLSYRQELGRANRGGSSPTADELSIARRQAATTLGRVLPSNHRIEIGLVDAADALRFRRDADESVADLLERVQLTEAETPTLMDLLGKGAAPTTLLGSWALQLPVRGLIDLRLLLEHYVGQQDPDAKPDFVPAGQIVKSMLSMLTAESALPHWATRLIEEQIIRETPAGEIRAVLSTAKRASIDIRRIRASVATYPLSVAPSGLLRFADVSLRDAYDFVVEVISDEHLAQLQPRLAAWFLLLLDVLNYAPRPLIVNAPPSMLQAKGPRIVTQWQCRRDAESFTLQLNWPQPTWASFHDHTRMDRPWQALRNLPAAASRQPNDKKGRGTPVQWLAVAWIDLVLEVATSHRGQKSHASGGPFADFDGDFSAFLRDVLKQADALAQQLEGSDLQLQTNATAISSTAMQDWLLFELPRFFTGELATGLGWSDAGPRFHERWLARAERIAERRRKALIEALHKALPARAKTSGEAPLENVWSELATEFDTRLDKAATPLAMGDTRRPPQPGRRNET